MTAKLGDPMLGRKSGQTRRLPNLYAPRNGNHDGCLLLTLRRCFNRVTRAASDGTENVEKVDGKDGVEKYLTIALRRPMPLKPAKDNNQIFDLDRETGHLAPARRSRVPLALTNRHIGQRLKLARSYLDGRKGLFHRRLGLLMATFGQVGIDC